MSPDAQRVAIAEACGWHVDPRHTQKNLPPQLECWTDGKKFLTKNNLPDYLRDLNAMHEAEKVLTPNQRFEYLALTQLQFTNVWRAAP